MAIHTGTNGQPNQQLVCPGQCSASMATQLAPHSAAPAVASFCPQQQSSCRECSALVRSRLDSSALLHCPPLLDVSSCSACLYSATGTTLLEYSPAPSLAASVQAWPTESIANTTQRRLPSINSRNSRQSRKSGRFGPRSSATAITTNLTNSNSTTVDRGNGRRGRNRPKTSGAKLISSGATVVNLCEPRLESILMPATLSTPSSGHGGQAQYLSTHSHQYGGKSGSMYKPYRYLLPNYSPVHGSVSPQPPPAEPQSNMWQSHLLPETSPLLTSMQALPLSLATPPPPGTLSGSLAYGGEIGSLGAASLIAASPGNGLGGGTASGSMASSGSTTPLNGNLHPSCGGQAHPQVLQQQHHQQAHHHLYHPSPTAITAALNQTPTPILNSDDTYICCAYSPRCFIIQKVKSLPPL